MKATVAMLTVDQAHVILQYLADYLTYILLLLLLSYVSRFSDFLSNCTRLLKAMFMSSTFEWLNSDEPQMSSVGKNLYAEVYLHI
jgi:hypothetical protein